MLIRDSDDQSLKSRIKCNNGRVSDEIRNVNFVIFVVDGLSILKSLDRAEDVDGLYAEVFASAFKSPYVSFRGIKIFWFLFVIFFFCYFISNSDLNV